MAEQSVLWRIQERLSAEAPRKEIQDYCEAAAAQFEFTPEQLASDGGEGYDHRHEWHDAHRGFAEMIERLLSDALAAESIDRSTFVSECEAALSAGGQAPSMLRFFLSMLLESGDYTKFVELMKMQHKMRTQIEAYQPADEDEEDDDGDGDEQDPSPDDRSGGYTAQS
eukprot:TRINITY_DN3983_c0_g1_i1.p1 TRINITY_DN3983_c0_g1~~TRINITY_DN3983_c0_g1_i1.p1  ORF type:complete len:168 (-),score=39.91 TRINITY_DN3983_c0_g1_i1:145-648(-)